MGSSQSTFPGTPLGCMLNNWKEFRRQADYGIVLCKDSLIKFCTLEWATLGVEWPEGGTLKPEIVQAVHSTVTRNGNWDQYPYIDIWQDLVANPPPWLQKCKTRTLKTLMARAPVKRPGPPVKKSCPPVIIPSAPDPMPPPPLYPGLPVLAAPITGPPPPEGSASAVETRDGPSSPGPSNQEPPPISLSSPVSSHTRSHDNQVTFHLSPAVAPERKIRRLTSNSAPGDTQLPLTRSPGRGEGNTAYAMPLRETFTPGGELTMLYVPFTSSDLYNWKHQNPPFSEDPAPLTTIFETLISAHNPTWGDMRVALNTLLTAEERRLVLSKAREGLRAREKSSAEIAAMLPETMPDWKYGDDGGRGKHREYAAAIVEGMRRCIRKTPNWAKLYNIRQEKSENPAAFYERLCNTCKKYTDLDPEDANGKWVLIPLFIGQSYEDIRKKLQKLDGASGKNIEELLEIAMKVYDRRDDEERKKGARVLALALREGNEEKGGKAKGRSGPPNKNRGKGPRLGRNQCAICKEEGHWKNECPRRHAKGKEYTDRVFPSPVYYSSTGLSGEGSSP
ncbi:uncharacterized protein LOC123351243 [Mauremys mutica]|uniref:uncharacterized protein LOC123351243 n=1 Tax=Mauremys mutica TaxID=74926 RepID=UPI001D150E8A|nr:uncharacterized protein LOC123351243 [Mauremys mutica]